MTKSELRKARKAARANGIPLTGELALHGRNERGPIAPKPARRRKRNEYASRDEQYARYLDCGPQNWDDR